MSKEIKKKTIPCQVCEEPTELLGTKLRDRCWELSHRIQSDPDLARKILDSIVIPSSHEEESE